MQKWVSDFLNGPVCFSKSEPPKKLFFFFATPCINDGNRAATVRATNHTCRWLYTAPALAERQRIRGASQASCSGSGDRQCGEFVAFSRLCLHWQTGSSARVCSRGPLFLYSEPALSCARRTGRQTSALTIIELIVFFLCYCPLFQKSPAPQNKSEHFGNQGSLGKVSKHQADLPLKIFLDESVLLLAKTSCERFVSANHNETPKLSETS